MTNLLIAAVIGLGALLIGAYLPSPRTWLRGSQGILERLDELEAELRRLTERETAHDIAWSEAKDQINRHLKRVAEIERRAGSSSQLNGATAARSRLLDLKLGKKEG